MGFELGLTLNFFRLDFYSACNGRYTALKACMFVGNEVAILSFTSNFLANVKFQG